MFEREIRDSMFLKRWSIVRTLRDQSIAEHSYLVTMYVNDICHILAVEPAVHLAALQYALWHDTRDEVFTGDMPGPAKRALIGPECKEAWDNKLAEWGNKTFGDLPARMGGSLPPNDAHLVRLIVKLADWMDAAMEMATEAQMGNNNCKSHTTSQMCHAQSALGDIGKYYHVDLGAIPFADQRPNTLETRVWELQNQLNEAFRSAEFGESRGPHVIAGE